ncbi:hypothetical protein MMRN_15840 [Mycobacterium marinum]|nr:hypothetical protein MMRN_15840 [Mycobacterium marinum]
MGFTVLTSTTSQRFKSKWIRSSLKRSPGLSKTRTPLKRGPGLSKTRTPQRRPGTRTPGARTQQNPHPSKEAREPRTPQRGPDSAKPAPSKEAGNPHPLKGARTQQNPHPSKEAREPRTPLKRGPGLSKARTSLKRRLGKFCTGYISPWLVEFPFPGEFD